jgi:hypothetical protein
MSRIVNRAENYERAYEAFQQINFAAWDFDSVRQSLIDYLKLYYPEEFNDFIESSELIALLDLFAYIAELSAYRFDLNAHENFITTAERKESILRLAKLLSYNPSRNIPARGLVKITSISTTETVFDSNGLNLANTTIRWNDPNNSNWKEQFIVVMNRVLDQDFGVVSPTDRIQIQDVLFEKYKFKNNPLTTNTLPYNIRASDRQLPMELVSADLNEFGPVETRPERNLNIGVLYLNDGLGDSSENTGFFMYTKQGTLSLTNASFDGITPNQTFDVNRVNTNNIDVYVNNVDDNGDIIANSDDFTSAQRSGLWFKVDNAGGQNILFNNDRTTRNKYEIETLDNDQFRLVFGDGKFANIPSGNFDIWSRQSANISLPIPTTAIQNLSSGFTYQDVNNSEQRFSFTFSLLSPIQNAAESEDIDSIRRVAPAVYYTQDRMVNGRDYNEFLLQDTSILKLRAINRTFAGDSKYIAWNDPSESYQDVKIFGDDGVVYFNTETGTEERCQSISASDLPAENAPNHEDLVDALVDNYFEPLLSSNEFFTKFVLEGIAPASIRTEFNATERAAIEGQLVNIINLGTGVVYFDFDSGGTDEWYVSTVADYWFSIELLPSGNWELCFETYRLVFHSDETKFYNTNDGETVITSDTLQGNLDNIVVLKANTGTSGILTQNYNFNVLSQLPISAGENLGQLSINDLLLLPVDSDEDGFPDSPDLSYLIGGSDYVYFNRETINDPWVFQTVNQDIDVAALWAADVDNLWKRERGVEGVNFAWFHRTPRYHLIDPAPSNIIDMYVLTRGYVTAIRQWLTNQIANEPVAPTPFQLRASYQNLLENKMISDTVILHSGKIKVLFGSKASPELRAKIKVIRSADRTLTDTQIKVSIVNAVNEYFDINRWEFGETFYFSELSGFIHSQLPIEINSVVLVPTFNITEFGDLYQVTAREDEILQANITVDDIEIVTALNAGTLRQ